MQLSVIKAALRRWWLVIALVVLAAAGISGLVTVTQPKQYTATALGMVSVGDALSRPPYALGSGAQYILDRMTSYANLGVTTPVLTPVVQDLGLSETPLSLSSHISSHSVVGKAVMQVDVTYADPKTAAAVADSVLAEMSKSVAGLERGNIQMVPIGAAVPPNAPSNGKVVINTGIAAIGGLVFGCFLALGLQLLFGRKKAGDG